MKQLAYWGAIIGSMTIPMFVQGIIERFGIGRVGQVLVGGIDFCNLPFSSRQGEGMERPKIPVQDCLVGEKMNHSMEKS